MTLGCSLRVFFIKYQIKKMYNNEFYKNSIFIKNASNAKNTIAKAIASSNLSLGVSPYFSTSSLLGLNIFLKIQDYGFKIQDFPSF